MRGRGWRAQGTALVVVALMIAGCGGDGSESGPAGGTDTVPPSLPDGGPLADAGDVPGDAGAHEDAAPPLDVDVPDTTSADTPDTAEPDATASDTSEPLDAGAPDTAEPDTIEPDTAEPDTVEPDTAEPDTAEPDTAEPDTSGPDATEPGCGEADDEKLVAPPARTGIVNGVSAHDPDVVALTEGQILSVGALWAYSCGWFGNCDWATSCTATLVAPTAVVTAAHCLEGVESAADLQFRVGQDGATPRQVFSVASFAYHPDYRPAAESAEYDVGVLILEEDATRAVRGIQPLPINWAGLPDGFLHTRVQNVGFGATTTSWFGDDNTERWWTVEEITSVADFEFVVYGGGVSSVCYGDSGGPALWTFPDGTIRIAGVVSWGDPSCVDYDHYARLDYNGEWLRSVLPTTGDCLGTTPEGRCEGDVAVWCGGEPPAPKSEDCRLSGWVCGEDDAGRARCLPGACAELDWEGACAPGEVAEWCEGGEVKRRRCAPCGERCGWGDDGLGFYCRPPAEG